MSVKRLPVLAAVVLLLGGCAIPLYPKCGGWLQGKERCLDRKSLAFIVPGETTKDDVIGKIGFPTRVLRNGTLYGYDWETPSWLVILAGPTTAAGGMLEKNHVLLVEFDENSRVVRYAERTGYFFPESKLPEKRSPAPAEDPAER
ncbi:MAG: hypothetical protein IH611_01370 [Deltaproteobacteria bacterium]|nr:hypothetical protein [Deltaproteobacteria bacterium]